MPAPPRPFGPAIIISVSRTSVVPGDVLTISGRDLDRPELLAVQINGTAAPIVSRSRDRLLVRVGTGAATGTGALDIFYRSGTVSYSRPITVTRPGSGAPPPPGAGGSGAGSGAGSGSGAGGRAANRVLNAGFGLVTGAATALAPAAILAGGAAIGGAANSVVSGAGSVLGQAYNVGVQLGTTLLQGVLAPFGKSGQAIGGLAGTVAGAGRGLIGLGAKGIGGALGGAGTLAGGVLSGAAGVGGAVLSGLGSAAGAIPIAGTVIGGVLAIGTVALTTLAATVGVVISQITRLITGILEGIGDAFGELGKVASGALSTVLDVLGDVLHTAAEVGRTVRQIQYVTGISGPAASRLVNAASFAGVDPSKVAGLYNSPFSAMMLGMRARMAGLPDPTANPEAFLIAGARRQAQAQRGGPMGIATFNAMLGPQLSETYGAAFALGPQRLQRNMQMANAFQLPGNIGQLGGDVDAANAALSSLARNLKIAVVEVLLPLAPLITSGFALLIQNRDAITGAIKSVVTWLVQVLPPALLRFGAIALTVFGKVTDVIGTALVNLSQHLPQFLSAVDLFLNGLRGAGAIIVGIVAAVLQGIYNALPANWQSKLFPGGTPGGASGGATGAGKSSITTTPASSGPYISPAMQFLTQAAGAFYGATAGAGLGKNITPGPLSLITMAAGAAAGMYAGWQGAGYGVNLVNAGVQKYNQVWNGSGGGIPGSGGSMPGAFNSASSGFLGLVPQSNLAATYGNDPALQAWLAQNGQRLQSGSPTALDWAKQLSGQADNWPDVLKRLDRIANASEKIAANTGQSGPIASAVGDVSARALAYSGEDIATGFLAVQPGRVYG